MRIPQLSFRHLVEGGGIAPSSQSTSLKGDTEVASRNTNKIESELNAVRRPKGATAGMGAHDQRELERLQRCAFCRRTRSSWRHSQCRNYHDRARSNRGDHRSDTKHSGNDRGRRNCLGQSNDEALSGCRGEIHHEPRTASGSRGVRNKKRSCCFSWCVDADGGYHGVEGRSRLRQNLSLWAG